MVSFWMAFISSFSCLLCLLPRSDISVYSQLKLLEISGLWDGGACSAFQNWGTHVFTCPTQRFLCRICMFSLFELPVTLISLTIKKLPRLNLPIWDMDTTTEKDYWSQFFHFLVRKEEVERLFFCLFVFFMLRTCKNPNINVFIYI